jgi:2-succinyl-5-enolpyruvyl-6-hydroxy-3-cyclohexene-1-carboxylate synthase
LPAFEHETETQFELIHGTPHDVNLSAAREMFKLDWHVLATPTGAARLSETHARPRVFEVRTDRTTNCSAYRALLRDLAKEADRS